MTGDVPYYGGRFTPAQAYAAAHPARLQGSPAIAPSRVSRDTSVADGRVGAQTEPDASDPERMLRSLQQLLAGGVLTPEEFQRLRDRMAT